MTDKLNRVCLLTDGVSPLVMGGMQKHSYYMLKYLCLSGVEVHIFHPGKGSILPHIQQDLHERVEEHIVPFPKSGGLPWSYLKNSYSYSMACLAIYRELSDECDFIYAQGFTAWSFLDRKRKGDSFPPIGVNFHGFEMFQKAIGIKQKVIQWMFKGPVKFNITRADVCYSLGSGLTSLLVESKIAERSKVSQIPIALEESWHLSEPKSFDDPSVKFLFIGRYERRKGIEELSEVIRSKPWEKAEFHFIGPIPAHKRIDKEGVIYHGKIMDEEELKKLVDSCHVLVVPSFSEGMPTVILEAMARGLMIIASDVGAVSDQVDEAVGILIPPGKKDRLADSIDKVLSLTSDQLSQKSDNARNRFMERFVWSQVIQATIKDIEERKNKE